MNKKIQYIILNLFRSIIKFSCFLGIFHTVNTLFKQFTEKFNEENRNGWSLVIMLFVMFSVSWCFYHFNRRAKRRFIESFGSSQNPHKKNSPFLVIRSLDFYSDATFCCLLSFISPFVFQYADIEKLFFENVKLQPSIQKICIGIFISTMFLLVQWFTIFDIRKKWMRDKEISSKNEILMIAAYLCFITAVYTVGFYIAMAYVPGLSAYIFLFKQLFWEILIVLAIIFLLINFNRIHKRKKFISSLKKVALTSDYILSDIKKPYLSVFKQTEGASFTVTAHKKTYHCKLISGKRKGVPIIFSDQGFLLYRRIIRLGKSELFSIYSKYDYSFQSDMKKCLIITCVPAQCYFKDSNGHMRPIDTGEKIGEYTIYSSQGFLGALERDCLDS